MCRFYFLLLAVCFSLTQLACAQKGQGVAMVIPEKDLVPESIVYHARTGQFFIGSLYKQKIIAVQNGVSRDFVLSGTKGVGSVCGMKIDDKKNILYAIMLRTRYIPTEAPADTSWYAAVAAYDILSGTLLHLYTTKDSALFNDLVIADNGQLYVTDPIGGSVYELNPLTATFNRLTAAKTFIGPNGITAHQHYLFIAHAAGITRMDLNTRQQKLLSFNQSTDTLAGVDGLYYYQQELIAVQNQAKPKRVIRMRLDPLLETVQSLSILDSSSQPIRKYSPTTGTLVGNDFYFIENAQVKAFDAQGKILPYEALDPIRIRSIRL